MVTARMVAIWLPFGAFARGFAALGDAERLGMPQNASECPSYMISQGRDTCPMRDVLHIRESPAFIGMNARCVVAPTGFEPVFEP